MASVNGHWTGFAAVETGIQNVSKRDNSRDALKKSRLKAARVAKRLSRKRYKTGHMKRNIRATVKRRRLIVGDLGRKVPYMGFQNFGTRRIKPARFLEGGLLSVSTQTQRDYERTVRRELRKAGFK